MAAIAISVSISPTATDLAVLYMGTEEEPAFWQWQGRFSYLLTSGFCGLAGVFCLKQACESWRSLQQVRTCPRLNFMGKNSRILGNPIPFRALIGFWQPELLVSQGLLSTLDRAHLQAVFKHKQGHYYYRDTFCFLARLGALLHCLVSQYRSPVARTIAIAENAS